MISAGRWVLTLPDKCCHKRAEKRQLNNTTQVDTSSELGCVISLDPQSNTGHCLLLVTALVEVTLLPLNTENQPGPSFCSGVREHRRSDDGLDPLCSQ